MDIFCHNYKPPWSPVKVNTNIVQKNVKKIIFGTKNFTSYYRVTA